jgi:Leucine-rich repeat (LRR) protein
MTPSTTPSVTPHPKRRWLRFGLRLLFLLTFVVAAVLGVTMKRLRDRKAAILAVKSAGGTMGVQISGPQWLQTLIGDEHTFWDPLRVSLGPIARQAGQEPPALDDALLARLRPSLKDFDHLEVLDIRGSTITDQSAPLLSTMGTLTHLRLSQTQITDQTIHEISRLGSLESLELYDTAVTDASLDDLFRLTNLTYLDVRRTRITPAAAAQLQERLPRCKISF